MGTPHKIDGIDVSRAIWTGHGATQEEAVAHAKRYVPPARVVAVVLQDSGQAAAHGDAAFPPAAYLHIVPSQECPACGGIAPPTPVTGEMITAGVFAAREHGVVVASPVAVEQIFRAMLAAAHR